MPNSILKLPAVSARTGLSRSSIYSFMAEGHFPRQIFLGSRSVGWLESEINSWINSRITASSKRTERERGAQS